MVTIDIEGNIKCDKCNEGMYFNAYDFNFTDENIQNLLQSNLYMLNIVYKWYISEENKKIVCPVCNGVCTAMELDYLKVGFNLSLHYLYYDRTYKDMYNDLKGKCAKLDLSEEDCQQLLKLICLDDVTLEGELKGRVKKVAGDLVLIPKNYKPDFFNLCINRDRKAIYDYAMARSEEIKKGINSECDLVRVKIGGNNNGNRFKM